METNEKKGKIMANPRDSGKLKGVAALLASLAALITAVAAINKPTDTEPTRKAYDSLATDIRELSKQVNQNHADTLALRDYVNGYVQGCTHRYPVKPTSDHGDFPKLPEPSLPPKRVDPEPFDLTQRMP